MSPNNAVQLNNIKDLSVCIRTQYTPFCFHLLPLFLTHWASDPLGMSVIAKIKRQYHHHEVILHIITEY